MHDDKKEAETVAAKTDMKEKSFMEIKLHPE